MKINVTIWIDRQKNRFEQGKVSFNLFLLVVFLLPINRQIFIIALWPWILSLIIETSLMGWRRWLNYLRVKPSVFFFPFLFILMMISMLWSENQLEGWNHIGRSVLLIIFPILIGFDKYLISNNHRFNKILRIYVYGALCSLALLLIHSLINSLSIEEGRVVFNPKVGEWEHAFFYDQFSISIHPTYYGLMILMAAAICLSQIRDNNVFSGANARPIVFSIILLSSLLLISSRSIIIASVFIFGWYLAGLIPNQRILQLGVILLVISFLVLSLLHPRFLSLRENLMNMDRLDFGKIIENTDRGKTWDASIRLIRERPIFGLGVGDVHESLIKAYSELGYFDESDRFLNSHNQFLETWLGIGLAGLVLLVFTLFYPFMVIRKFNKRAYVGFFLIILVGFMFESLLNRLWGVAFVSLFYTLLTAGIKNTKDSNKWGMISGF